MSSSLGAFLDVMYKKRELEYKAALEQSKADVAGAEAIGGAIKSIGGAVGAIGSGIGGYMDKQAQGATDTALMQQAGIEPVGGSRLGSSSYELDRRIQMGEFKDTGPTSYQQSQLDLAVQRENRIRQENLSNTATTARKDATKSYTDTVANHQAYQKDTQANMAKLYAAGSADEFNTHKQYQESLNVGGRKAGVPEDQLQPIPQQWIPPSTGGDTGAANTNFPRYPAVSSPSASVNVRGPTGVPQGAIPVPALQGQPAGATGTYNGKPYIWDGNFMVPNPNARR